MSEDRSKRAHATARDRGAYGVPARARAPSGRDEDWLERKVRDMYQEVVNEPVPDEILGVLNRIPKPGH
jgi:Anti-sigma factor NepR